METKKVRCIKDYCHTNKSVSENPLKIEKGEVLEILKANCGQNGKSEEMVFNSNGHGFKWTVINVNDESFSDHFIYQNNKNQSNGNNSGTNQPPYVRVYFYPNGDENKGVIKAVEGWLENDYPQNLAIRTIDNCLCKFKFNNIEQMYPVKQPSDDIYDEVYKNIMGGKNEFIKQDKN